MPQHGLSYLSSVAGLILLTCAQAAAPPGSSRFAIFIRDTHFGVGKDASAERDAWFHDRLASAVEELSELAPKDVKKAKKKRA